MPKLAHLTKRRLIRTGLMLLPATVILVGFLATGTTAAPVVPGLQPGMVTPGGPRPFPINPRNGTPPEIASAIGPRVIQTPFPTPRPGEPLRHPTPAIALTMAARPTVLPTIVPTPYPTPSFVRAPKVTREHLLAPLNNIPVGAVFRGRPFRIDRFDAKLVTTGELEQAMASMRGTSPITDDVNRMVWVMAMSGTIPMSSRDGRQFTWGVFISDPETARPILQTAYDIGTWPPFFDALPDHDPANPRPLSR